MNPNPILGLLFLTGAIACLAMLWKVLRYLPTRWLKGGLGLVLFVSGLIQLWRAARYLFGLPYNEIVVVWFAATFSVGCIFTWLALLGVLNGPKKL